MPERATGADEADASGHRARLRKRLLEAGPDGFHDYELIEYLLALTIPRVDTKPLAKRLIHDFGGIGPLLSTSADTLRREGLTDPTVAALKIAEATALRLLEARVEEQPILSSWEALGDYLHAAMAHSRVEEVRILFLNAKNVLIANEALWQGSVDEASVHVREVIARAITLGATALISPQPPERRSKSQSARHPPDPRPGRSGAAHESDRARSCDRRRPGPHQHARDGAHLNFLEARTQPC